MRLATAYVLPVLAVLMPLASVGTAHAEPAPVAVPSAVPTTKVLAIGRLTASARPEALQKVMPAEVRATVELYLKGKIDQWYVKQDGGGVVFMMNVTSAQEARDLLEALPLGQAGLMTFDLTPLGPLNPLRRLIMP